MPWEIRGSAPLLPSALPALLRLQLRKVRPPQPSTRALTHTHTQSHTHLYPPPTLNTPHLPSPAPPHTSTPSLHIGEVSLCTEGLGPPHPLTSPHTLAPLAQSQTPRVTCHHRRNQTCDMKGMVVVLTGTRVRIGYEIALKLLRAGATVVGTTSAARASVNMFAPACGSAGRASTPVISYPRSFNIDQPQDASAHHPPAILIG